MSVSSKRTIAVVTFGILLLSPLFATADSGESVDVMLDQARIVRLPDNVATLVIGNPAVADGTLQSGGLLVITGKSYGTTNIIALDQKGNVLSEQNVTVGAPKQETLTVWRGAKRETWSCAPRCEQSVMLGDDPEYFGSAVSQVQNRNNFAAGQAIQQSK